MAVVFLTAVETPTFVEKKSGWRHLPLITHPTPITGAMALDERCLVTTRTPFPPFSLLGDAAVAGGEGPFAVP